MCWCPAPTNHTHRSISVWIRFVRPHTYFVKYIFSRISFAPTFLSAVLKGKLNLGFNAGHKRWGSRSIQTVKVCSFHYTLFFMFKRWLHLKLNVQTVDCLDWFIVTWSRICRVELFSNLVHSVTLPSISPHHGSSRRLLLSVNGDITSCLLLPSHPLSVLSLLSFSLHSF